MFLSLLTLVCATAFIACTILLRIRMHRLSVVYESRMRSHADADIARLEREIADAARHAKVMQRNEMLFRLLWPHEYDRALSAAQHYIARTSSAIAIATR
jgi:hypothetical protein